MYSPRRTSLSETSRTHGTKQAKILAGHDSNSNLIHDYYDTVGMGDIDVQGWRFGSHMTSKNELSKKPRQGYTTVHRTYVRDEPRREYVDILRPAYNACVETMLRERREYMQIQEEMKTH